MIHRVTAAALILAAALPAAAIDLNRPAEPVALRLAVDGSAAAQRVRLFVELDLPPVAALRGDALAAGRTLTRGAQIAHARRITAQQDAVEARVAALAERIDGRLRIAVNGFRVVAERRNIPALRSLPGVSAVRPVELHVPDVAGSVPWIGADALWSSIGDGTGTTIAIIDTGVDYGHANFGGDGDPRAYRRNDPAVIEAGSFPTDKVVGGHDFAGPTYDARDPDAVPAPDPDPVDGNGHGSHVAGIAAGIGVAQRIGPGVAPGASLLALKVFSDASGSTDLVADAIEYALDPNGDGAIEDRVDVINMSLGSPFGDPRDPSAVAAAAAVANGVIVVASAGNRGDKPYVTGSPGVAPEVISVASSVPGNRRHPALSVHAPDGTLDVTYEAREGTGPVRIADRPHSAPLVAALAPAVDDEGAPIAGEVDDRACLPVINAAELAGAMALIGEGGCSFDLKYRRLQTAGATAVVAVTDREAPYVMPGVGSSGALVAIPGLMVGAAAGATLREILAAGSTLVATFDPTLTVPADGADDDVLSGFSSRGPAHGGSGFKPDLAAPGTGIFSTDAGSGTGDRRLSGTSMAAPHVAGVAALLRSLHPTLPVAAIKALLQNATVDTAGDIVYPVTRQGTGVLRADRAATLSSYASPAGVSFGHFNETQTIKRAVAATVHNLGPSPRRYQVTQVLNRSMAGVTVTCPQTVDVEAHGSSAVQLVLQLDPAAVPADDGLMSQREVDGWCVLDDGSDRLRVAYVAVVDAASTLAASGESARVRLTNDGPSRGWAEGFTLAAQRGAPVGDGGNPVVAVGFRRADFFGFDGMEFALVTAQPWESPAHLVYEFYVDVDEDGTDEYLLHVSDWSVLRGTPGNLITAQFSLDENGETLGGVIDWIFFTADFNDRVLIAPFTLEPEFGIGFLEPGDTDFSWRLVATHRDGSTSELDGYVDLAAGVQPAAASVAVDTGETVVIGTDGGPMLWLYQTNQADQQAQAMTLPRSDRDRPAGTRRVAAPVPSPRRR